MPQLSIHSNVMTSPAIADPPSRPVFSIVVPIWNEEQVIPELYKRVVEIMDSTGESWELICVNDGSRDQSVPGTQGPRSTVTRDWGRGTRQRLRR